MRRSGWLYAAGVALAAAGLMALPRTTTVHAATVPSAPKQVWVTLVTGDRVLASVNGTAVQLVEVEPGRGRKTVTFRHRTDHGDEYVVPSDAAKLIETDRVDRRLFDLSLLVRSGYDDRSRTTLPLILTGQATTGVRMTKTLASVGGGATQLPKTEATGFWKSVTAAKPARLTAATSRIWLDGKVTGQLDKSVPQIGAPEAWKAGYTGKGVKVAVLDSGIDTGHPDLADAVVGAQDFTGSASGTTDKFGHGTHVAGIITGDGTASGGKYVGVAPDATLLNGKVLADFGYGYDSWVIAGMEWAVAQGARVVNMSLGKNDAEPDDPTAAAVDRLTDESGTLFVVAAGNSGPQSGTVGSPGMADRALTVGAVDRNDVLADFSSRGLPYGDGLKPDVTAPGVDIVSALAEGSVVDQSFPTVDGHYVALSGTSMATPHVAGAAAILAGEHPGWSATELKSSLMATAVPHDGTSVYDQGAGRIDVGAASKDAVFATPPSVSGGTASWPHDDDQPIDRTLTYHNDGDTALTLHLDARLEDPAGNAAPDGMFSLSQPDVTVPAHGTAAVHLVADTRVNAPDGRYQGYLVATGGDTVIRTAVGLNREVESYDVTVQAIGPDGGTPTTGYWAGFADVATGVQSQSDGTRVVRLPKGTYFVVDHLDVPDGSGGTTLALGSEPSYTVDGPKTFVIDARKARPIGFTLDRPDAALAGNVNIGFFRTVAGQTFSDEYIGLPAHYTVMPSQTSAPAGQFTYRVVGTAARADGNGGFRGSPYSYVIEWKHDGNVPADLNPRLRDGEFARVEHTIAASGPDQDAWLGPVGPLATPSRVTEFVMPGLKWWNGVGLFHRGEDPDEVAPQTVLYALPSTYQVGQVTRKRWNYGAFGPGLAPHPTFSPYLVRDSDIIYAAIPLFGDQSADHIGWGTTDTVRQALSKDGQPIGESTQDADVFTVPDEAGTYRLEETATRSNAEFTTQVSAAWTFTSTKVVDTPLPVLAVRFAPALDDHNRAAAGKPATYPVYVQQGAGASYGTLTTLTVDASYDDGKTWTPARVTGTGLTRAVTVGHPAGAKFVSLRATAADDHGTAVTQTLIRAYGLK